MEVSEKKNTFIDGKPVSTHSDLKQSLFLRDFLSCIFQEVMQICATEDRDVAFFFGIPSAHRAKAEWRSHKTPQGLETKRDSLITFQSKM